MKIKNARILGYTRFMSSTSLTPPPGPVEPPTDLPTAPPRSHNTNSVLAQHQPTQADFAQYGRPGTSWYVQVARWTTPYETDVNEYAIQPGAIQFYLNNKLLPFSGVDAYQQTIGDLVQVISGVPGWSAQISYAEDNASDPVLVVYYTAGAQPMAGLQIAYPNDVRGQTGPHPAVEVFYNGDWKYGSPVDGAGQPISPAGYAFKKWDFAGGAAEYDETGGRGPTGESASTETTRQAVPAKGPTYPSLVSIASGLTEASLATDLGLPTTDFASVLIPMFDDGYTSARFSYDEDTTVGEIIADLNYYDFAYANLDEAGHLILANIATTATPANAFDIDSDGAKAVFGTNPTAVPHYMQSFNNSSILYKSTTLLAPFAAKGILEVGVYVEEATVSVGFISGKGAPLQPGQRALVTMADLLDAINEVPGALAFLEEGRLVVGVNNVLEDPTTLLIQRYIDAELHQGEPIGFHSGANLLFGATDFRFESGSSFLYNDQRATIAGFNAFNRMIFAGPSIPAQPTYAAVDPSRVDPVKLGTRVVNRTDLLSQYYPIGYLIEPYNSVFGNRYQNTALEITATTTIRDMMNYVGTTVGTLRMIEADGTHNSTSGFLRFTGLGAEIIWSNPANGEFGLADRFFVNNGEGNAAPTNKIV